MARNATIDHLVYDRIHRAILEQRLPPGTKLGEESLSSLFAVSRARVRRILLRLAHDKSVELRPNRGAYVAQPSAQDAREVFTARRIVEAHTVEGVAKGLPTPARQRLLRHVAREQAAHARSPVRRVPPAPRARRGQPGPDVVLARARGTHVADHRGLRRTWLVVLRLRRASGPARPARGRARPGRGRPDDPPPAGDRRPAEPRSDTEDTGRPPRRVRQAGEEWPGVMKIKVINPNTTESMTEKIGAAARGVAAEGTMIVAASPAMGPVSIEGHYDEAVSVLGLLEEIRKGEADGCDGYVIACFGDPGLLAAREIARGPVLGIAEAAMHSASMIAAGFTIVTTLERTRGIARQLER